ncbi:NifB/NifX family molybdenum-iron cluster-binding protein [Methanococcoides sp. SA1]|nr:NifB/NifX family molybdenum-iron cluster-binding protein [Methanococcoides sp. SA1]
MKICITSRGTDLFSQCDPRFGRCPYFVIVDDDTMRYEALENPGPLAEGGAGIKAAQALTALGIDALLTGKMGPNAFSVLNAAGIKVFTGIHGAIEETVSQYKEGQLDLIEDATTSAQHRINSGSRPELSGPK